MVRSPPRRSRDNDRGYRQRSRSRDRNVREQFPPGGRNGHSSRGQHRYDDRRRNDDRDRYHDRDDRRRGDRYDDRRERSQPRERERERKRSRDGDRNGSDDHARKRSRFEEESSRGANRRDDRGPRNDRMSSKDRESSRPSTADSSRKAAAEAEEEAKKAKLAKVAAWKQKRLVESGKGAASPAAESPSATTQVPTPDVSSPPNHGSPSKDSPAPASGPAYAGDFDPAAAGKKAFDPKAIAKRAAAAMERSKAASLGGDVVIPKSVNQPSNGVTTQANNSKPASMGKPKMSRADAKISGFGLSKAAEKSDKLSAAGKGTAAPLEEEEESKRKLEKLPDMPMTDVSDAAFANDEDAQEEGDAIRSEDEEEEHLREAAQKRAEQAQAEQEDVPMTDGDADPADAETSSGAVEDVKMGGEEEDEVDPLDAFMEGLVPSAPKSRVNLAIGKKAPQIFDADDEQGNMAAVGDADDDEILNLAAKKKKKEMPNIDHSAIKYDDFRKNFYSESVELADMSPDDVEELRMELENIKCRGIDVPKPIMKWSQGGFGAQIVDVIREQKFEKPTPIQSQALPAIMSGRDVIGIAKTGSGKTLAFILPMFRHIKDQRPIENLEGPVGLILAPTRELVTQIHRECKPYLKAMGLRAVCAYGGAPIKDQIAELKRGAEIVVATAGRFIDLLAANAGRVTNLRRVTYMVMDEADRMFDMGFEPQITKILKNIRPDRQTVLFSATFPRNMEALARKALTKPVEIIVGGRSVVPPEITQVIEVREEKTKFKRLIELLGALHDKDEDARSLIFVERQETADRMLRDVMQKGYPILAVHGGREQIDRDQSISDFKAGIAPVMVATSVAARGLDVKQLKLVVNFDSPNHIEDYVHRAGRTGRAGNTGTAVTFVTPEQDRFAPFLIKALKDSNQEPPEELVQLQQAHEEKVKSGEAKKVGSGFGGRGVERLDAARDAERAREKRQYTTGDEPEEKKEDDPEKKKQEKQVEDMLAKAKGGGVKEREKETTADESILPAALKTLLKNAMQVQKAPTPAPAASKPGSESVADRIAKAKAAAATIGTRLGKSGGTKSGTPMDNRGPDAGEYHAILEINDFPQSARWGVTNRTNVARVLELTGTSITTKGNYYKEGTEPKVGDPPKLYILVEGDTERQVESAMAELTSFLRAGTISALQGELSKGAPMGRYSVV
ncbi:pre-mRNA processing RNA-helicase [Saxophila tyrrhenica]|uniref:RNA helicase n=1 Tax=Saxophila tyrrhenica TaxID=1690608 RepID=A0AAV9P693_9PEZI|nr:pre-mRNA processing RNA-helicase [Saxophila tyrrhenica]